MARISRLTRNEVSPETGEIYDRYMRQRGNVPNMFRTVAHRPEIFQTMIAHFEAILNTGTLPLKLKELVIVRTSQLNRCEYCLASHSRICRKLGWSDDQLAHLDHYALRDDFTLQEKTGLRLAELMTRNERPLTDAEWQEMRDAFSEGEIVELMAAIGLFNYFNRFNNLLDMEATAPATAAQYSSTTT
ncbi:MAG: carboxymuconolactone decarboxylase family protein [Acidobacteriaceae bacterium]|jgi:uncharacterized peroxidase-related enzyme